MSRTVLINNVYSYHEGGDTAIVETMMEYVREVCPGARIVLLSNFWEENDKYYRRAGAESAPQLWDIPMDEKKFRRALRACKAMLSVGLMCLRVPGLNSRTMELYRECDALLDVGGGSLYSSCKHKFSLGLYQHLFNLWYGAKIGKPVIVAPQSVGPFNSERDADATASVLRKLDVVMMREQVSSKFCTDRGVRHVFTPDIVFLSNFLKSPTAEAMKYRATLPDRKLFRIGVTVMNWLFSKPGLATGPEGEKRLAEYVDAVAEALLKVNAVRPLHVSIFPQVKVGFGDNDLTVSRRLAAKLEGRIPSVSVADGDLTASDFGNLYGDMDAFLGSRMHSAIFALNQGIPTVALAYQPKTIGTFELLGLDEYAVEILDASADKIAAMLTQIVTNYSAEKARFTRAALKARKDVRDMLDETWKPILTGDVKPIAQPRPWTDSPLKAAGVEMSESAA